MLSNFNQSREMKSLNIIVLRDRFVQKSTECEWVSRFLVQVKERKCAIADKSPAESPNFESR